MPGWRGVYGDIGRPIVSSTHRVHVRTHREDGLEG
ncbi:uncharacterized protein METZ01_LOCUS329960, partial [marine metagenome]